MLSDGDHCNAIEPCDEFDWSGADDQSIESLINFVESRKNEDMKSAVDSWSQKYVMEADRSSAGLVGLAGVSAAEDIGRNDHWSHRLGSKPKDGVWMRNHTRPRYALFTPCKVNDGPMDLEDIISTRVTIGKFDDGESFFHVDNWKDGAVAHQKMRTKWTGTTFLHEVPVHKR